MNRYSQGEIMNVEDKWKNKTQDETLKQNSSTF